MKWLFLIVLTILSLIKVLGQKVPCKSEVLLGDYYGEKKRTLWNDKDLSSEIDTFKKTNKFSISFWMNQAAELSLLVEVKKLSGTEENLLLIKTDSTTNPSLKQLIIDSKYLQDQNNGIQKIDIDKLWTYVFVTFDLVDNAKSINAYSCNKLEASGNPSSMIPKINHTSSVLSMTETNFNFNTILIQMKDITDNEKIKTRNIYLHRSYGNIDIKDDYQRIISMMMREDTELISYYLFNLDILDSYIIDNNENNQNNINVNAYVSNQIPTLFHNSLRFFNKNYFKLNALQMSPISREFTISFSVFTDIADPENNTSPYKEYSLLTIQNSDGSNIITILLQSQNKFYDKISFLFSKSTIKKQITCDLPRNAWNYITIVGYSYGRISDNMIPKKYYFDIFLEQQYCQTLSDEQIDIQSDHYFLVFGNPYSEYQGYFQIKALRIYKGSYAPASSGCNSYCYLQQRRQHTKTEELKQYQVESNKPYQFDDVSSSSLYQLANIIVDKQQSLSCLKCEENQYMVGEYCVTGASQCSDGIDSWANQCFPTPQCSDPLHHPTDCIRKCKSGYAIDQNADCVISCHHSCQQCTLSQENICINNNTNNSSSNNNDSSGICSRTRIYDETSKQCKCKDNIIENNVVIVSYYEDGVSNECLALYKDLLNGNLFPNNPIQSLIYIFDIQYQQNQFKPNQSEAVFMKTSLINSSDSPTMVLSGIQDTMKAHADYGIQYFSKNYAQINQFISNTMMSMKCWVYIEGELGRNVRVIAYKKGNQNIVEVILNQFNKFEYSIQLCFYSQCQSVSPLKLKLKVSQWNQIALSFEISLSPFDLQEITLFVNALSHLFRFYNNINGVTVQPSFDSVMFGSLDNIFSKSTYFFATRYISFYTQPFKYYFPAQDNCLIYSGSDCILCQQGYYFSKYDSTPIKCEDEKLITPTTTDHFYFSALKMIHQCSINKLICQSCDNVPSQCLQCVGDRDPKNNCDCQAGFYSDKDDKCQQCSGRCKKCVGERTNCIECFNEYRSITPACNCVQGRLEETEEGNCIPCHSSCANCDNQTCNCPDLSKTFRYSDLSSRSCPCQPGFYDITNSNQSCKACFPNCVDCVGGKENECYRCKVDESEKNKVEYKDVTVLGQCLCKDSDKYYLDFNGFCQPYATLEVQLLQNSYAPKPIIQLTLSQPIEDSQKSNWLSLIQIQIITIDKKPHNRRRVLQDEEEKDQKNLILTVRNDKENKNIGYIDINVKQSCLADQLHIKLLSNTAVRSKNGVPLLKSYTSAMYIYDISPFILNFEQTDLNLYQSYYEFINSVQDNNFVSFLRYISFPLFFVNCLQPITSLLFIDTVYPIKAHLFISKFASFVFPHTPDWIVYNIFGQNTYSKNDQKQSESIYGNNVTTEDQTSSEQFMNMGIGCSFLVNITETLVLLFINGIVIISLKILDISTFPFFQGKFYQNYAISFMLNLIEVRLIYIFISIFLQFTNMNFSNALNGISAILSIISFLLYLFFLFQIKKSIQLLNEQLKKEAHEFRNIQTRDKKAPSSIQHMIDYLDLTKHWICVNYRFISLIKKTIYFMVLILLQKSPILVIVLLLIISIGGFIIDGLFRSFQTNLINILKIISSLSWLALMITILISYKKYKTIKDVDYIIDQSAIDSYQNVGEAIYIIIIIYFSSNIGILVFKIGQSIYELYQHIISNKQAQIIFKDDEGVYQQIGMANIQSNPNQTNDENQFKITTQKYFLAKNDKHLFNHKNAKQDKESKIHC